MSDLLCGSGGGGVFCFKNVGTAQVPSLAAGTPLQAGGTSLNLGIRSMVRMFDWDGDGVRHLVGSSDNGVYWCKNVGLAAAPLLLAPVTLRAPISAGGLAPIYTGPRMRLDLVDWNNDSVVDLLVGNLNGTVSYYESYRFALTALTAEPSGQLVLKWNSAPFLSFHVLAGPAIAVITNRVATGVPTGGMTTCWTNSCADTPQFCRLQLAQ